MAKSRTGGAVVLGPNTAQQYWLQQNQRMQDRRYAQEQKDIANLQRTNQQFSKDLMDLGELSNTQMYGTELNAISNGLIEEGAKFQNANINPYLDSSRLSPENRAAVTAFQQDMAKAKRAKTVIDAITKERDAIRKKVSESPTSYDIDDFKEIMNFENKYSLEDIVNGNFEMPQLNKILNIEEETGKLPEMKITGQEEYLDEQGNPRVRTFTRPDVPRITAEIDRMFTKGTQWANEADRRLRKAGIQGDINGILGTLDKNEIRNMIDDQLRSNTPDNPMVGLISSGRVPSFDSPEYNKFLDDAVEEQLKAEKIVNDLKSQVLNARVNRVNPSETSKYDFTLENQRLRREAAARQAANNALNMKYTRARINKLVNGSSAENDLLGQSSDFTFDILNDSGEETGNFIGAFNTLPFNTSPININPTKAIDVTSGQATKMDETRGNITGIGITAFDSKGNAVAGDINELSKKEGVTFKPTVIFQHGREGSKETVFYDPKDIPVSTLTKQARSAYEEALRLAKKTAEQQNSMKKEEPIKENKQSDLRGYQQGQVDVLNPSNQRTPSPVRRKINY